MGFRVPDIAFYVASTVQVDGSNAISTQYTFQTVQANGGSGSSNLSTITLNHDNLTISGNVHRPLLFLLVDSGSTITIEHGSGNISIADGNNRELQAGTVAQFIYDGSNWYLIGLELNVPNLSTLSSIDGANDTIPIYDQSGGALKKITVDSFISNASPPITIQETDGTPGGQPDTLKFANNSLTDNGDGSFTYKAPFNPKAPVRTVTANASIVAGDFTVLCDTTSNSITVTLPNATVLSGHMFNIGYKAGTNFVTINGSSSQTISGESSVQLTEVGEVINIQSDGTNWYYYA